ncbi:MAG: carboxypeptidase regulatory-like domain-containing protein [Chitinivibrionales bacterium]|nr:carboxypeptidase regulatory-like domain-containing protein [Chitinivibrionales bacterium]
MNRFISFLSLTVILFGLVPTVAQTPYILTEFPVTIIPADTAVWIKWTGVSRLPSDVNSTPDSGFIYVATAPGGSIIANYPSRIQTFKDSNNILFKLPNEQNVPQRGIKFMPSENGLNAGIYYIMVAFPTTIGIKDTTFFSSEIQLIVEASTGPQPLAPKTSEVVTNMTPVFQWSKVTGVPYYHIIVSDEKINLDMNKKSVEGLSIIWEAITSSTQITYGSTDPSGTISATPPPLSPGKEYNWIVLNNYGNHAAFSSVSAFNLPSSFTVAGDTLKKPINVWRYSDTISADTLPTVTLRWRNCDSKANTYKIYLYIAKKFNDIGAQMVLWTSEVTASSFVNDTGLVSFNPRSILTDNRYTWRVIAVDNKGSGTTGDTTGFYYSAPSGTLQVYTKENIIVGASTITKSVGLTEIKVEVMDGSMEAPLLFYTDQSGYLNRERPTGTYRLTAVKEGFMSQTKTVSVTNGSTATETFYLKRPDATIFGKVVDASVVPINLARVVARSDVGDSAVTLTDPQGNFILSCHEARWNIVASKTGYGTTLGVDTSVTYGQNIQLSDSIVLQKNSYSLSGIVSNEKGMPLIGATVQLLRNGVEIAQLPSTPQTGQFSFSVNSGTYQIKVTKVGFTSATISVEVTGSKQLTIALASGAAMVKGQILGRSWNSNFSVIYAPLTKAKLFLIDTTATVPDTISCMTDGVYGDFSVSVPGSKSYLLRGQAAGFKLGSSRVVVTTESGKTHTVSDTMIRLATIGGVVRPSDSALSKIANVSVSLMDTAAKKVVVTTISDAVGAFELRDIPDGNARKIAAGYSGWIADSVILVDSAGSRIVSNLVHVSNGRLIRLDNGVPVRSIILAMERGAKKLHWYVHHAASPVATAQIKLSSPLVKTLKATDTLTGVGIGQYTLGVDGFTDSLLDCSYHLFAIPDVPTELHRDTVALPIAHHNRDTLALSAGKTSIVCQSRGVALDTGFVFFKSANAAVYDSIGYAAMTVSGTEYTYTFQVQPGFDGSYIRYYFRLSAGNSQYGSLYRSYTSFIAPDTATVTKLVVTPTADSMKVPAGADITFDFLCYYGSEFLPLTTGISAQNVSWQLLSGGGCSITSATQKATVRTAAAGSGATAVVLAAVFQPGTTLKLAPGLSDTVKVQFWVTASSLDSVAVVRVDADTRGYITTSAIDDAEFVAQGYDGLKNRVTITPTWDMQPTTAGIITNGLFKPHADFIGLVQITATVGLKSGSFVPSNSKKAGLPVYYLMTKAADTISNSNDCSISLPPNALGTHSEGELSLTKPPITNDVFTGSFISNSTDTTKKNAVTGKIDLISPIFDIQDVDSVLTFSAGSTDSVGLVLTIAEKYRQLASSGNNQIYIAMWDDSLSRWSVLTRSTLSVDRRSISVQTRHFSRYAIIAKPLETSGECIVRPNPFSPYVRPVAEYGQNAQYGTCIEVAATSATDQKLSINLDIYNIVGDRVWSVFLNGASSGNYMVWWDGRSNARVHSVEMKSGTETIIPPAGDQLCRNGRYFLVMTLQDSKKEKQYLRQVVLFK